MMSPKEHAEAVRSLARCDATVADQNGQQFLWRVERSAMPSLPSDGCWYLYFGGSALPTALKALVKRLCDEPPPTTDELPPPNSTALCAMLKRAAQTADGLPRDPVLAAAHALPRLNPETHFIPQPSPKPKPKP